MQASLFLQSSAPNPYEFYAHVRTQTQIVWDSVNQLWSVYSYAYCKQLLHTDTAHVPSPNNSQLALLNPYALRLTQNLARLSNPPHHVIARQVVFRLVEKMPLVNVAALMEALLAQTAGATVIDWVETVAKKLPTLVILKAFRFSATACEVVLGRLEQLVQLMGRIQSEEQMVAVNETVQEVYLLTEQHVIQSGLLQTLLPQSEVASVEEKTDLYVCNLIGLFIQSYHAGRGLLSNALLQFLSRADATHLSSEKSDFIAKHVTETLRFDPPIHHTRRILTEDLKLGEHVLQQNQTVVIVLAAANRDPKQFENAEKFDPLRKNNEELLTFGAGMHRCLAQHFSTSMTTAAIQYLLERYPKMTLPAQAIRYEPLPNARLPQQLLLSLTH